MTINQRIRKVREATGLSQSRFSERISLSSGYYAAIELGNRNVNDRIIKLVCSEFHVSEAWLRLGYGEMLKKPSRDEEFLQIMTEIQLSDDPIIQHIIKAYWQLSDSDKLVVQRMVKNFVDELQKDKS